MERKNSFYAIAIIALAVAVVSLSVAFAFTDIQLAVNGTVTTKATSWDVHINEIKNANASGATVGTAATITPNSDSLTANYTVTLNKPGDYYEFDVEVINAGDFDARLSSIAMTSTTSIAYLNHVVTYNSTAYTDATNTVTGNSNLASGGGKETVHVKIEYVQPSSETQLPTTDVTAASYTVTLTYVQATGA